MADLNTLGKYLNQYREDHKMDIDEMSIALNVSGFYLYDIEHGIQEPTELFYDAFIKKFKIEESEAESLKSTFGIS